MLKLFTCYCTDSFFHQYSVKLNKYQFYMKICLVAIASFDFLWSYFEPRFDTLFQFKKIFKLFFEFWRLG